MFLPLPVFARRCLLLKSALLFALFSVLSLTACDGKDEFNPEGAWTVDIEKSLQADPVLDAAAGNELRAMELPLYIVDLKNKTVTIKDNQKEFVLEILRQEILESGVWELDVLPGWLSEDERAALDGAVTPMTWTRSPDGLVSMDYLGISLIMKKHRN